MSTSEHCHVTCPQDVTPLRVEADKRKTCGSAKTKLRSATREGARFGFGSMHESLCRQCQEPIMFARTEAGKPMPLDPARHDADDEVANVAVFRDHTGRLNARVLKAGEQPAKFEWRAMPHFAPCKRLLAERREKRRRALGENVVPFQARGRRR